MIIDDYEDINNVGDISYWYRIIRDDIDQAIGITNQLKKTRNRSLVITKLEEAAMWLNKSWEDD